MPKGQKPKPSVIKQREGNRSKVGRAKIRDDPRGKGRPTVPQHLSADERMLWAHVIRSLPIELLTMADDGVLERYAVAWNTFRQANALIDKDNLTVRSPQGDKPNPLLAVRNVAAKEMHAAGSDLGLSPAARARLSLAVGDAEDPMSLLLGMTGEEDDDDVPPREKRN